MFVNYNVARSVVTALITYLYISYMLSFQATEMKEKTQLATGESRNLNIPVKLKKTNAILFIVTCY